MGEMIEGFGDEVVLFAAFLALSLVFLSLLTCTRRQRSPDRAESTQEGENHAHVQQPAEEEGQGHRPEAHSDSADQLQFIPGADGLRHRTPVASTAGSHQQRGSGQLSGDREQPSINSGQLPDWQHRGGDVRQPNPQPGGSNEQKPSDIGGGHRTTEAEGQINIRLIQAGGPGLARQVCVAPTVTLQYLRRTYFQNELSEHRPVKFIYQGRLLSNDDTTLRDLSIGEGGAMHVHVGRPHPPGMPPQPQEPEMPDLSRFFVPLFGIILAVVWGAMLLYPYVFTLLSKLFLFLLSIGYVILTYVTTYGE